MDKNSKCVNGLCKSFKKCKWASAYKYRKLKDDEQYKYILVKRKSCKNFEPKEK